jgi:aminopeptidase N
MVNGFLDEYAYNSMSSFDLRDYIHAHTGMDVTDFFNAWVFSSGFPDFSIDSFNVIPAENIYNVTVNARQKYKGGSGYANSNKIEITFIDEGWQTFTSYLYFSGRIGSQVFEVPFEPVTVFCDLFDKTCDATTDREQVIKSTGEYDFPDTFFKLTADAVGDSAFVRITHHWVAPDSLKNGVNGLRLSDYRYWQIDGIFPDGFVATGRFQYNRNTYLDNTLLTNSEDSIVILYRPDAGHDWQSVEFTKVGIWSLGNLYVSNIQKGEYTLAIWDHSVGSDNMMPEKPSKIRIFPNPSKGYFNFEITNDEVRWIVISDNRGRAVGSLLIIPSQKKITWYSGDLPSGTYYVQLENEDHISIECAKLILLK